MFQRTTRVEQGLIPSCRYLLILVFAAHFVFSSFDTLVTVTAGFRSNQLKHLKFFLKLVRKHQNAGRKRHDTFNIVFLFDFPYEILFF